MELLVKVLKLVDQDKKPTLSIIYEAMDRAKLAIKASVKHWERYWEVIDIRWANQLYRHLHAEGKKKKFLIQLLLSYLKAKYYKIIYIFLLMSSYFLNLML